jgi:hypothetical protein
MTREELFDAWAPTGGPWSDWAKPVLFAHWPRPLPAVADAPPADISWVPPSAERVALVIDLPGAASVQVGLALAAVGYRPVPLFNACPPPVEGEPGVAVVVVEPILAALAHGGRPAARLRPPGRRPAGVPPRRRSTNGSPRPGPWGVRQPLGGVPHRLPVGRSPGRSRDHPSRADARATGADRRRPGGRLATLAGRRAPAGCEVAVAGRPAGPPGAAPADLVGATGPVADAGLPPTEPGRRVRAFIPHPTGG